MMHRIIQVEQKNNYLKKHTHNGHKRVTTLTEHETAVTTSQQSSSIKTPHSHNAPRRRPRHHLIKFQMYVSHECII